MSSRRLSRRSLLKGGAALFALNASRVGSPLRAAGAGMRVAVVGAGAFGGWTALHLVRRGAKVVVLASWGPGTSRASSGGETRVIRATYGPDRIYVDMVVRSLRQWRESETSWGRPLFRKTGVLWMAGSDEGYEKAAVPLLRAAGLAVEVMETSAAATRFPQINFDGVRWGLLEKEAGYLLARRACQAVLECFQAQGGEYRQVAAAPGAITRGAMGPLRLSDGSTLSAD